MTIWEIVEEALSGLDIPMAASAMIMPSGDELPDIYLVYFLVSSPPELHADDEEIMRSYRVQISAFSRSGLANLPDVDSAMTAAGFAKSGKRELPYNLATRHYHLASDYIYTMNGENDDASY